LTQWNTAANRQEKPQKLRVGPHPWARTGPGIALDGLPKFNLEQWNEAYFDRLRQRVQEAGERGVYAAVMLFEGWGLQFVDGAWEAHPFHPANHINRLDPNPDANGDGKGLEVHELGNPAVLEIQEAYVRKVIDTVNDLDNVLYEISNENHPASTPWQYHMIRLIQQYEREKPRQHLVGMSFQYKGGRNSDLFASPADWVSPNPEAPGAFSYRDNPPPADGGKLVISDTDHLWGIGGNVAWVWKTFLRGHHPIFMDPYDGSVLRRGDEKQWEQIRKAMGVVRRLSQQIDLARLTPQADLVGGGFCLAEPQRTYLLWAPKGETVTVPGVPPGATFKATRIDPVTGSGQTQQVVANQAGISLGSSLADGTWLLEVDTGERKASR
jgi:hypothetical protein